MFITISISIALKGLVLTRKGFEAAKSLASPGTGLLQACSLVPSALAMTFVGVIYIAETGWNYR